MDIYTQECMIRYFYKETSTEETLAIEQALESDWTLREKYEAMKKTIGGLNTIQLSPRNSTLKSIMAYAEGSKELEHH